ncbi:unknown [Firmicutes bacterium CAG:884]|nr:unknown [Firmicutes bacterium CAG:884]
MNAGITNYAQMFSNTATDPNAKITVNYTSATSSLVDSMIATKASNSNVVKGNQI